MTTEFNMDKLFERIYDENYSMIYRYFYYRTGSSQTSEDLTAECFLKAYQALPAYDDKKSAVLTWLMVIAKNTYIDFARREKFKAYCGDENFEEIPDDSDPFSSIYADEIKKVLYSAMSELSEKERGLIAMKYSAELKNKEIAGIIGISERYTAVMLGRTLNKLKKILKRKGVNYYE